MPNNHSDHAPGHHKVYTIIISGRQREVDSKKLSYSEIVELAFPGASSDPNVVFTVAYANTHGKDGTLVEGQNVKIKNGMIFNVTQTNRS